MPLHDGGGLHQMSGVSPVRPVAAKESPEKAEGRSVERQLGIRFETLSPDHIRSMFYLLYQLYFWSLQQKKSFVGVF